MTAPHQWPGTPPDGDPEVVAWKCKACGCWVSEWYPGTTPEPCPIDWRQAAEEQPDA